MAELKSQRALRDDDVVRSVIAELDEIIDDLHARAEEAVAPALLRVSEMLGSIGRYVDLERSEVLPTLRDGELWNLVRTRTPAQRSAVLRAAAELDPGVLAVDLSELVHLLRDRLEHDRPLPAGRRRVRQPNAD